MNTDLYRVVVRNRFTREVIEDPTLMFLEELYHVQDEYFLKPWIEVEAVRLFKEEQK